MKVEDTVILDLKSFEVKTEPFNFLFSMKMDIELIKFRINSSLHKFYLILS